MGITRESRVQIPLGPPRDLMKKLRFATRCLSKKLGLSNRPIFATVSITEHCNSRCRYCQIWKHKPKEELTTEGWKELFLELYDLGVCGLGIEGGEPFLRPNIIELLEFASRKMFIHLTSNGTLVNEKIAKALSNIDIEVIGISLESLNPSIHNKLRGINCWDKAVNSLKLLKRFGNGSKISTSTLINKYNADEIEDFVKFWTEREIWTTVSIPTISPNFYLRSSDYSVLSSKFLAALEKVKQMKKDGYMILTPTACLDYLIETQGRKRFGCLGFDLFFHVHADGSISACQDFLPIKIDNMRDFWNSKKRNIEKKKALSCSGCCYPCYPTMSIAWKDWTKAFEMKSLLKHKI